jgi:hypothetical protein
MPLRRFTSTLLLGVGTAAALGLQAAPAGSDPDGRHPGGGAVRRPGTADDTVSAGQGRVHRSRGRVGSRSTGAGRCRAGERPGHPAG